MPKLTALMITNRTFDRELRSSVVIVETLHQAPTQKNELVHFESTRRHGSAAVQMRKRYSHAQIDRPDDYKQNLRSGAAVKCRDCGDTSPSTHTKKRACPL